MLVFPDGVTLVNRAKIAGFAMALGLSSMFGWREYCDAGGLIITARTSVLLTFGSQIMRAASCVA